jgi:hypothetical protein
VFEHRNRRYIDWRSLNVILSTHHQLTCAETIDSTIQRVDFALSTVRPIGQVRLEKRWPAFDVRCHYSH